LSGLRTRLRRAFQRGAMDQQMLDEMKHHLDEETARRIAVGEDPATARRRAAADFGSVDARTEEVRDARFGAWAEHFWQDLRFAARNLRKSPGFTAVAVLTLAIGIGANTAIFSVVSGLLLNPLPYADSDRIMVIDEAPVPGGTGGSCGGTFLEWQENQIHFESMAAIHTMTHTMTGRGDPQMVNGWEVTPQYLSLFGLRTALGRDFRPEDDVAGANEHIVILSHRFWQETFNGDPGVVGDFVNFGGEGYQIIGVLDPDALLDPDVQFLSPTGILNDEQKQTRNYHYVTTTFAKLAPGATPAAAAAQLTTVKQGFNHLYPDRKKDWTVTVTSMQESMFGGARQPLNLLLWSVGVVLLIACANVANLLLAKTSARSGELALRLALGATKGRIIRQMLTESLLLAVLGGAAGIAVAAATINPLVVFAGVNDLQRIEIGLDGGVLAFALGASLLTGFVFGLLPALRAAGPNVGDAIKDGGRSGSAGRRRHLQSILIIAETALTVVLLVVAGLLMRSFLNAANQNLGFETDGALTFRLNQNGDTAQTVEKRLQFADQILAELRTIPGVESAAFISNMPMNGNRFYGDSIQRADRIEPDNNIIAGFDAVSPGYFQTMRTPLLRGRDLTAADNRIDAPKVLIVNQSVIDRFFDADENPLGYHIQFKGEPHEIVGVVADARRFAVDGQPFRQVYLPLAQFPWSTHYVLRTQLQPASLAAAVRQAVQRVNPNQPIHQLRTLEDMADETLNFRTMMLTLLSLFAGAALLLACVGIYGVMAYSVNQRTREMGIRLALGAAARDVIALILRDGLKVIAIGLAIGAIGAGFASHLLESQLYNVDPLDPATFVMVSLILVAVGATACFLPAVRASKTDPMQSLRAE
ncbi:ABC transporter permease, partial [Synoicihabitans lomoniglobus]|nr:ABC transporter permease [Opitutaceae bacterium LMO-M01]